MEAHQEISESGRQSSDDNSSGSCMRSVVRIGGIQNRADVLPVYVGGHWSCLLLRFAISGRYLEKQLSKLSNMYIT